MAQDLSSFTASNMRALAQQSPSSSIPKHKMEHCLKCVKEAAMDGKRSVIYTWEMADPEAMCQELRSRGFVAKVTSYSHHPMQDPSISISC